MHDDFASCCVGGPYAHHLVKTPHECTVPSGAFYVEPASHPASHDTPHRPYAGPLRRAPSRRSRRQGASKGSRRAPHHAGTPNRANHASRAQSCQIMPSHASRAGPLRGDSVPTPLRRMRSAHAHEVRVKRHAAAPPGAAGERVQGDAVSRLPEALELEFRWTGAVVSHVSTGRSRRLQPASQAMQDPMLAALASPSHGAVDAGMCRFFGRGGSEPACERAPAKASHQHPTNAGLYLRTSSLRLSRHTKGTVVCRDGNSSVSDHHLADKIQAERPQAFKS